LPAKYNQRNRFLQPEEMPQFFNTLKATDQGENVFDRAFQDYVLLLLFTSSRKMNLLCMRWADISFERAEWTISGDETKMATR
jgi:integrase